MSGKTTLPPAPLLTLVAALILLVACGSAGAYDWLQFNGDSRHSGNNTAERTLSRGNIAGLSMLFKAVLPDVADNAPLYVESVATAGGRRDLLILTTRDGRVLARDAGSGAPVWEQRNPPGDCRINNGPRVCYTTASPAVDPERRFVYAYGLDGRAHKYRIGDGQESIGNGWPALCSLKPFDEKGSSDLTIATAADGRTYLYVPSGGYPGDRGDYQGHITVIDLADGRQRVFNCNCSAQAVHFEEQPGEPDCPARRSAVWARAGVVYYAALDRIYLATGNGPFDPARGNWGDSVLALRPDGSGSGGGPLDSYTPTDFQYLEQTDQDLGSTAPAILPVPASSAVPHLAVQGGKDALLRLLDLADLNGTGVPGRTGGEVGAVIPVPQGGELLTAPAVWTDPRDGSTWVFVANARGISGLTLEVDGKGIPRLEARWKEGRGGTSPIVAGGLLFYAGDHLVRALDPTSGSLLWEDTGIGRIHWQSPIVANGRLYVTDEAGTLTVYGLLR
jgi:outer membrane protein assembly factor BamB